MRHFLLVYDKSTGRLLEERQFDDYHEALLARFSVEKELASTRRSALEVVVLSANSRDELLRTHARYFLTLDQLAMRMARE